MSEQADKANAFMRKQLGAKADEAAAASNFTVLPGGGDSGSGSGGGAERKVEHWVKLPTLQWRLSQMAQQVGMVMAEEEMFSREGVPVLVDQDTGHMQGVTAQKLRSELERWLVFWKGKAGTDDKGESTTHRLAVSMTVDVARGLLEATDFTSRLRQISRVNKVRMPVIRADGKVELLPDGYDEQSGVYTLKSGLKINEEMTLEAAQAVFTHYLKEFPFEDKRSLAVAITAMVSLYGTCMLPPEAARMGFVWRSNDRGGGKSLSAQMAIVAPFGLPATTDIRDRNKLAESLDSAALQCEPYLFFDNLEGTVKNTMLDNFITAPARRVRLFHTQKTVEAVASTVLLFTGNNLEVSPDIDRRTLLCRLFVREFDLTTRHIENPINVVKLMQPAVRAEMLSAMWALVRNWHAKGQPKASTEDKANYRRPSFEEWSEVFGGIVQAAGYGNPLIPAGDEKSASTEQVQQRRLVECLAWKIPEGGSGWTIREFQEIVDVCYDEELFSERLLDGGKEQLVGVKGEEKMRWVPSKSAVAWLGRFMTLSVCGNEEGRDYVLPATKEPPRPVRKVRIGYHGRGRHKAYWLKWVT